MLRGSQGKKKQKEGRSLRWLSKDLQGVPIEDSEGDENSSTTSSRAGSLQLEGHTCSLASLCLVRDYRA